MRRTGIFDLDKINRITYYEYSMIMKAVSLRNVDNIQMSSNQAYFIQMMKAVDDNGYLHFRSPKDLYNAEEAEALALNKTYYDGLSKKEQTKADFFTALNNSKRGG